MRKGHTRNLRKGRISIPGQIYHIRFSTYKRQGLIDISVGQIFAQSLTEICQTSHVQVLAWVAMPDHVHLLIELNGEQLSEFVRLLKGRSALAINRLLQRAGPVWQQGFYDHALREDETVRQVARYIVANPLRAGLVSSVREYALWDAVWL